jgi:hypothetical protein
MIAIVFLTRKPHATMLEYIPELKRDGYDIYVCADDMLSGPFLQYTSRECEEAGYKNGLLPWHMSRPSAWEKALYHFCEKDTQYEHVWFIEDDVLITSADALYTMDQQYPASDVLSESHIVVTKYKRDWHWQLAHNIIELPWAKSMMCACRLSKRLLQIIREYVDIHKTLLYHEFMFNTLAMQHGLVVETPDGLNGITYQYKWKLDEMEPGVLYHPVKDIGSHPLLRKLIHSSRPRT